MCLRVFDMCVQVQEALDRIGESHGQLEQDVQVLTGRVDKLEEHGKDAKERNDKVLTHSYAQGKHTRYQNGGKRFAGHCNSSKGVMKAGVVELVYWLAVMTERSK